MSYYRVLGLEREPFSTSPDPAFFFLSKRHKAALYRLQIAISLKRGLSIILGDVGTGKTTLSRKLCQVLREEKDVCFNMILNPYFSTQKQFLMKVVSLFHIDLPAKRPTGPDCIEAVERFLYEKGVEEQKNVVLLVDEAQLLPDYVLEILRILLNYETNEYKILQLILVGQMELLPRIRRMSNFWDRIALKFLLRPLDVEETRELIEFRLAQAGYEGNRPLFSDGAVEVVHRQTRGYPRRLAMLCHQLLETLVMEDRATVDEELVNRVATSERESVELAIGGLTDVF
jgi:general secretion pathway protein A